MRNARRRCHFVAARVTGKWRYSLGGGEPEEPAAPQRKGADGADPDGGAAQRAAHLADDQSPDTE